MFAIHRPLQAINDSRDAARHVPTGHNQLQLVEVMLLFIVYCSFLLISEPLRFARPLAKGTYSHW